MGVLDFLLLAKISSERFIWELTKRSRSSLLILSFSSNSKTSATSISLPMSLSGNAPIFFSNDLRVLISPLCLAPTLPDSKRSITSLKLWKPEPLNALFNFSINSYIFSIRLFGFPVTKLLSFLATRIISATASSIWTTAFLSS